MKILLIAGHGGADPGACANGYKEAELTREFTTMLCENLKPYAETDVFDISKDAYTYLKSGGMIPFNNYDYVLEIHFDSWDTKANGTGVLVHETEKATTVEERIVNSIALHGFMNRGITPRDNLLVMNTCKEKYGVSHALIEVCFIDNKIDMDNYQDKKSYIALSVANAISAGFGLSKNTENISTDEAINIIRKKVGLEDNTLDFMQMYKYGDDLVRKLAEALSK